MQITIGTSRKTYTTRLFVYSLALIFTQKFAPLRFPLCRALAIQEFLVDKMGWQILLGLKLAALALGIVASLLPPWEIEAAVRSFSEMARKGFVTAAFLILAMGFASLVRNLWVVFIKKEPWVHFYHQGPEHLLVAIYTISVPLVYIVGAWVLIPAYAITILLVMFIVLAYVADERKREQTSR